MFESRHGNFELLLHHNLLLASASGSWNLQVAQDYSASFYALQDKLPQPFGHLVLLENWELAVPAAEDEVHKLGDWCVGQGISHSALVFSASPLKVYQLERMLPEELRFEKRIFTDVTPALEWLAEQGYPIGLQLATAVLELPPIMRRLISADL